MARGGRRTWWIVGVCVLGGLASEVLQPFAGSDPSHPPAIDARRLSDHVRALGVVPTYVLDALHALGLAPFEEVYAVEGQTSRNVRVLVGPPSSDRVVVGARGDDASAIAVLLELARTLAAAPPNGCVELVVYGTEGSTAHARVLGSEGVHVRAMIGLAELHGSAWIIGRLGGERLVQATKRAMSGATTLPVHARVAPRAFLRRSSQTSYWAEGDEAVLVTGAPSHDETLDYARMAQTTQDIHAAIVALARP